MRAIRAAWKRKKARVSGSGMVSSTVYDANST